MLQPICKSGLTFVYITTELNRELAEVNPPSLAIDVDSDRDRERLVENAKYAAYNYDAYQEIVQVSFLTANSCTHFLQCAGADISRHEDGGIDRTVIACSDEREIVWGMMDAISKVCQDCNGYPMSYNTLVGWKIYTEIWPRIVNKALAFGQPIPLGLKSDPTRRFSTLEGMIDVSNIYSQGMSLAMRRLPAMGDTLEYWGYDREHVCPDYIRKHLCDDPLATARAIEVYLTDMQDFVLRYYPQQEEGVVV